MSLVPNEGCIDPTCEFRPQVEALHQRVQELEKLIELKDEGILKREKEFHQQVQDLRDQLSIKEGLFSLKEKEYHQLQQENQALREQLECKHSYANIGEGNVCRRCGEREQDHLIAKPYPDLHDEGAR